ncbi:MAG: lipid-A-disaccharide synthase [Gammaproteobacteria bacterium]
MPRIAIVAGELSGDRLGAGLICALRERMPSLSFVGIGGAGMQAAGCDVWLSSDELAVMGLAEVLSHLPRLRRILLDLEARLLADKPDLFIGIDAPDFNLRLERRLRARGIPTVHYVSPSVWAWRPGRVRVLRDACDQVLCLLPFEASFLHRHAVPATFVGHPLADEIQPGADQLSARRSLDLPESGPIVAVMPGSRSGEVSRLGAVFAASLGELAGRVPGLNAVVPVATPALRSQIARLWTPAATGGVPTHLIDGQAQTAMAAADVVLLASGTATLEAMLVNRPMVVAYRLAPATYALLKMLRLVRVEYFSLPNLLAGECLVPELLQGAATPAALSREVAGWLESPTRRAQLHERFHALAAGLRLGASDRAAEAVLGVLNGGQNRRSMT